MRLPKPCPRRVAADRCLGPCQRHFRAHLNPAQAACYRVAYGSIEMNTPALAFWRNYLAASNTKVPPEMIMVSLPLSNGRWFNAATPIKTPPRFFSKTLGLSKLVMLVAVVAISAVIVRRMTGPVTQLSHAAEKLGTDVRSPAIPETGPLVVRRTAHTFNVIQARIRKFVEDRTQMLAAIAHDLGTPITRLRLRAEFVEDDELRSKMHRDLDDMQHMVASTLAFIREDATSEPRETVDLGSLLARVRDDIQDTGAEVALAEVPRWIVLECRPAALRRAIGNLVENAVKYGGLARVSLQQTEDFILICVDDEGPGIPESFLEDAFAPFRRLDAARNFETGGTGLGLSVARTIVRAHGHVLAHPVAGELWSDVHVHSGAVCDGLVHRSVLHPDLFGLSGKVCRRRGGLGHRGHSGRRLFRSHADGGGVSVGLCLHHRRRRDQPNGPVVKPGERVLFKIVSNDVIHGVNIPVASITAEIDPAELRQLWIKAPDEPGKYLIQCVNNCGVGHAQMKTRLVVEDEEEETASMAVQETDNGA